MLGSLDSLGVKTVTISQPYVLRNGRAIDNYRELAPKGMFVADSTGKAPQEVVIWVGEGGMFDVAKPDTRRWLSDRYKALTDMGVGGWWATSASLKCHPESGRHANGLTAREYHNKYGNDWSSIISELYAEKYPRPPIAPHSCAEAPQASSATAYSPGAPTYRARGAVLSHRCASCSTRVSAASGYMSSDLGGFAVDEANPYMPELYVRWVQSELFSPVFRTHAQQYAEPYHYPQYEEILKAIVRERYRWLPYNYTLRLRERRLRLAAGAPARLSQARHRAATTTSPTNIWVSEVMVAPRHDRRRSIAQGDIPRRLHMGRLLRPCAPATKAAQSWPTTPRRSTVCPSSCVKAPSYPPPTTLWTTPATTAPTTLPSPTTLHLSKATTPLYDDNRMSPRALADSEYRLIHFTGEMKDGMVNIAISPEGTYPGAPEVVKLHFRIVLPDGSVRTFDVQLNPARIQKLRL